MTGGKPQARNQTLHKVPQHKSSFCAVRKFRENSYTYQKLRASPRDKGNAETSKGPAADVGPTLDTSCSAWGIRRASSHESGLLTQLPGPGTFPEHPCECLFSSVREKYFPVPGTLSFELQ